MAKDFLDSIFAAPPISEPRRAFGEAWASARKMHKAITRLAKAAPEEATKLTDGNARGAYGAGVAVSLHLPVKHLVSEAWPYSSTIE